MNIAGQNDAQNSQDTPFNTLRLDRMQGESRNRRLAGLACIVKSFPSRVGDFRLTSYWVKYTRNYSGVQAEG